MKTSTASIAGLALLVSNSFKLTGISNAAFTKIAAPSCVASKLTTLPSAATPLNGLGNVAVRPASVYSRWKITLAAVAPSWLKAGAAVAFTANTSAGVNLDQAAIVESLGGNGLSFVIAVRNSPISSELTDDVLAGTPIVTLIIQAQKVVFSTPAGNTDSVLIADGADINGVSQGWSQAIPAGSDGYDYAPVTGAKLDLADWYVKSASGAQTILIRFI